MTQFYPWPSIDNTQTVRKSILRLNLPPQAIMYLGKVKVHGTNAAVQLHPDGTVVAQSRERVLTPTSDNYGFAAWVAAQKWRTPKELTIIYGEWCGPGIQKEVAISKIPNRTFAVFSAQVGENLIYDPDMLEGLVGSILNVHVIPWEGDLFSFDWGWDTDRLTEVFDKIDAKVSEVEDCDPWVKATFGISGIGEGLVYYPVGKEAKADFSLYAFKAKGGKHRGTATKKAAQALPEKVAGVQEYVALAVTEPRLEQGLEQVGGPVITNMGAFISWVCKDCAKETQTELSASGLEFKQVQNQVVLKARNWFKEKCS